MRVLILTPEFMPVYGGVGNYVVQIAKNMPPDVELHIVTPQHAFGEGVASDGPDSEESLPDNVNVIHLGRSTDTFFHNFSFQMNCAKFVPDFVRRKNIDVVHSQSAMPDYLVSLRTLGAAAVTTMHTTVEGHYRALRMIGDYENLSTSERFVLAFGPALGLMERRYYTNRRSYITVSEWAKRMMVQTQGIRSDRIRVIRIGVDPDVFNPSKRTESREMFPSLAGRGEPKILYLSRLAARKGIHTFLEAASLALKKVDAHFIIAGSGRQPDINLPKGSYTYLGYLPRHAPPYLYALSDVFVLPSFYENFPACILEAMASGSVAISTRVGGIPEMIEDGVNGVLLDPGDSSALASAMVRLVEDDAWRRSLSSKGMNHAVGGYSWKDMAVRTRDYYDDVLRTRVKDPRRTI